MTCVLDKWALCKGGREGEKGLLEKAFLQKLQAQKNTLFSQTRSCTTLSLWPQAHVWGFVFFFFAFTRPNFDQCGSKLWNGPCDNLTLVSHTANGISFHQQLFCNSPRGSAWRNPHFCWQNFPWRKRPWFVDKTYSAIVYQFTGWLGWGGPGSAKAILGFGDI